MTVSDFSPTQEEAEGQHLDAETVARELHQASRALAGATIKLGKLNKDFNGRVNEDTGEFEAGPGRRYSNAVAVRKVKLYKDAIRYQQRPPGEDARQAIAEVEIAEEDPALVAAHDVLEIEITGLKQFVSSQKQVIEGHRSVLSALKVLA